MASRHRKIAPALRLSLGAHGVLLAAFAAAPSIWPLLGVALNHAILAAGMRPGSRMLGENVTRLPSASVARGEVALTFDDGPDPDVTPLVLDRLDRHGARASFFCIGERARAHPDLIRDIVRRGHSIENHTNSHLFSFACRLPGRLRREVGEAQTTLECLAGRPPTFIRAPVGLRSPLLDPVLAETSLVYVSWTRRALDGVRGDPAAALRRLERGLRAGDVLLMHDGNSIRTRSGRPVVLDVLPALLDRLDQRGLRAVSLPMAFATPDRLAAPTINRAFAAPASATSASADADAAGWPSPSAGYASR